MSYRTRSGLPACSTPQSPRRNRSTHHPARPVMRRRRRISGTWRGASTPKWDKRYVVSNPGEVRGLGCSSEQVM